MSAPEVSCILPISFHLWSVKVKPLSHCVRILSLDGGGIRGFASLLILKDIMRGIARRSDQPNRTPLPCEYFDLICGTSTGGLIAIMLGRLRMVPSITCKHNCSLLTTVSKNTRNFRRQCSKSTMSWPELSPPETIHVVSITKNWRMP